MSEIWRQARTEWGLTGRPTPGGLAHPISLVSVYAILRNPFYAGKIFRKGTLYDGEHPPMVTWAQFEEVQAKLAHHHRAAPVHHVHAFLYQGLLHCGHCGRLMSGELIQKRTHAYIYYRCGRRRAGYVQCRSMAIPEPQVTDELIAAFENVTIDPTIRDWAFEAVAWWAGEDEPPPEDVARRAKSRLARAEHELETLTDMAVQGLLTLEEYKVRKLNQVAKVDHLREALADPVEKLKAWRMLRDEKKQNGLKLAEEFRAGDAPTKRNIVTRTCSDVLITNGNALPQLKSPFVTRIKPSDLQGGLLDQKSDHTQIIQ